MRFQLLTALTALATFALADVEFTAPAAGATIAGGTRVTVSFEESGDDPSISDLASYQLFLCAGGNTADTYQQLVSLVPSGTFATLSTTVTIPVGVGGTGTNAYFLMMLSTASAGGTVTNFSPRFTLTGMTGTFNAVVQSGLTSVSGTAGPDTINSVTGSSSTAEGGMYTVPYHLQTGLIKYAPMQPIPGTKITAKTVTPMNPTSAYTIATTYMPAPTITYTQTDQQTHSVSSAENTIAAAQTRVKDDMGNWLRRWAD